MKIVINTLNQISGVEVFPIISLIIFFTFFLLVGYLAFSAPKSYIDEMSHLPLEDDNNFSSDNDNLKH